MTVRAPSFLQQPAVRSWGETLSDAQTLAEAGQTSAADSLLAQYADRYPESPKAQEANYWRALFALRASSSSAPRLAAAVPLLQRYVDAGPATEHWMEATALLQAATRLHSLSHGATYLSKGEVTSDAAANARGVDAKTEAKAATADSKAQDDEIRRLKDELAKSKDELDRIKKRLAEPTKKPPRTVD